MRRLSAATKAPPSASDERWRTARALAVIAWYRHRRRSAKLGGLAAARAWLAGPKGFASAPIAEKPPLVLGLEPQPLEVVVQVPTPTPPSTAYLPLTRSLSRPLSRLATLILPDPYPEPDP